MKTGNAGIAFLLSHISRIILRYGAEALAKATSRGTRRRQKQAEIGALVVRAIMVRPSLLRKIAGIFFWKLALSEKEIVGKVEALHEPLVVALQESESGLRAIQFLYGIMHAEHVLRHALSPFGVHR